MMKKFKLFLKSKKASSILVVVIVMCLLVLLGLGVTTMTLGTLKNNVADSSQNDAYYASESGITSAIDQLKYEVISYYRSMDSASYAAYGALYGNFFSNINANMQTQFIEPTIEGVTTSTVFSVGSFDAVNNVCEFQIQCISTTADNTRYLVNASVYIKKIDIKADSGKLYFVDNCALLVGDTLEFDEDNGALISGGNVIVSEVTYPEAKEPYRMKDGIFYTIPNAGDDITDQLVYTSYTDPVVSSPDMIAIIDTIVDWSNVPASPAVITTLPGVNLFFDACNITDGLIYGQGDITINGGSYNLDLYCDGDLNISGCKIVGDIYVRGNFTGDDAVVTGNLTCDGTVNWTNGSITGYIIAEDGVVISDASSVGSIFSSGIIDITRAGVNGALVYSSSKIVIGDCSIKAVLYTFGDIEFTDSLSNTGAIIAKGDVYFTEPGSHFTIRYEPNDLDNMIDEINFDFFISADEGAKGDLDENLFVSQEITPIGRVN